LGVSLGATIESQSGMKELCQSCGQAVIPQREGKVLRKGTVASLEILSPRNLSSLALTEKVFTPF